MLPILTIVSHDHSTLLIWKRFGKSVLIDTFCDTPSGEVVVVKKQTRLCMLLGKHHRNRRTVPARTGTDAYLMQS